MRAPTTATASAPRSTGTAHENVPFTTGAMERDFHEYHNPSTKRAAAPSATPAVQSRGRFHRERAGFVTLGAVIFLPAAFVLSRRKRKGSTLLPIRKMSAYRRSFRRRASLLALSDASTILDMMPPKVQVYLFT